MIHWDQPDTSATGQKLPIPRTSFVGREHAVAAVRDLLQAAPVLTLTGPAGSGKTRLALRVAEEERPAYPGAVWWVDLAALNDPDLLPAAIAGVLGIREHPDRSLSDLVLDELRERAALLVLDNCEHLRATCAAIIETLSAGTAARVLATSREPLGAVGEHVWRVPLLHLPDPHAPLPFEGVLATEAVQLFVERARAVAPGFTVDRQNVEVVTEICRRLEGMPLAIELAAARVNVLTVQQIAERLDNSLRLLTRGAPASDARHSMLRSAIEWSFDLLSRPEQTLFTRLAVFVGPFDLEAVEGVCSGPPLPRDVILDLLARLVEQSLVITAEQGDVMRYRLLEPIRHYAVERLQAGGDEEQWLERHAGYLSDLAERAELNLHGPDQARWLARLDHELDNMRAMLAWCVLTRRTETGLKIASALDRFWHLRGFLSEGQRWLQALLNQADTTITPELHVRALNTSAGLYGRQSHFEAARARYEQSLPIAYRAEQAEGILNALTGLGAVRWELGDFPGARAVLEEAVQVAREQQSLQALARALGQLALVHQYQGDLKGATTLYEEALLLDRRLGNHARTATALYNLAQVAKQAGDYTVAHDRFLEALATYRQLGHRPGMADALLSLGELCVDLGDNSTAAISLADAEQIYRDLGAWGDVGYVRAALGDIAFYDGEYAEARAQYREALRLFRAAGNRRLIGRALGRLGQIAVRMRDLVNAAQLCAQALTLRREIGHTAGLLFSLDRGYIELAVAVNRPTVAAALLGAVEAARDALGQPRLPMEERDLAPIIAHVRTELGDERFGSLRNEGRMMSLDQAAMYALDSLSPAEVSQPRPDLRIFALGPLRVYSGDRLLTSADWTYAKARELVLYLLCHPTATREQIGVALWPDASTAQVRQRLSAALAHARGALGRQVEWITLVNGRYQFNRARPYWFDVEVFEDRLRSAHGLLRTDAQDQRAVALLEEAVNLYDKDFAEDLLESDWPTIRREALHDTYLEALLTLGRLHTATGRDEQAIAVYQRALARDPYLEDAHHNVIAAYARLDKRRQAFAQYTTLQAALAELGTTASDKTTALIERLKQRAAL